MSSTISVSRRAAAFLSRGVIYYALMETSYESNVSPKTPRECCVAFGTARQVNAWILKATSACVSGCLRRPGGPFTPAGYLRSWRTALACPIALHDRSITISPSDDSIAVMRKHGRDGQAGLLEQGLDATLCLHGGADVLADLVGEKPGNAGQPPWRAIQPCGFGVVDRSLAMKRHPVSAAGASIPAIYTTGLAASSDDRPLFAIRRTDGRMVLMEEWNVIVRLLTCEAYESELAAEGTGLALAQALLTPNGMPTQSLPDSATLTYTLKATSKAYVDPFLEALAPFGSVSKDRLEFTTAMGSIRAASDEARRQLGVLATRASIHLPAAAAESDCTRGDGVQAGLFDKAA